MLSYNFPGMICYIVYGTPEKKSKKGFSRLDPSYIYVLLSFSNSGNLQINATAWNAVINFYLLYCVRYPRCVVKFFFNFRNTPIPAYIFKDRYGTFYESDFPFSWMSSLE